jgi:hypothetical protein
LGVQLRAPTPLIGGRNNWCTLCKSLGGFQSQTACCGERQVLPAEVLLLFSL